MLKCIQMSFQHLHLFFLMDIWIYHRNNEMRNCIMKQNGLLSVLYNPHKINLQYYCRNHSSFSLVCSTPILKALCHSHIHSHSRMIRRVIMWIYSLFCRILIVQKKMMQKWRVHLIHY